MKIKNKYKDFLESDKLNLTVDNPRSSYQMIQINLFKIPLKDDCGWAVYSTSHLLNGINDNSFNYLFSIDKDFNIIHMEPSYRIKNYIEFLFDIENTSEIDELSTNMKEKFNTLKDDYLEALKVGLQKYDEEFYEEYNYDNYIYDVKQEFLRPNQNKLIHPIDKINDVNITTDLIVDFIKNEIEKNIDNYISEGLLNKYKKYLLFSKAYQQYKNELLKQPDSNIAKQLTDILRDDKYKSFKINYNEPNGEQNAITYKKKSNYGNQYANIMNNESILDIPISSISKITYRNNVILENKIKKDKKELAIDFLKPPHPRYLDIIKAFPKDKDIAFKIINDYFKKFHSIKIYNNLDDSIKFDVNFLDNTFKWLCEYKKNTTLFLSFSEMDFRILSNYDLVSCIFKYFDNFTIDTQQWFLDSICNYVDDDFFNESLFINITKVVSNINKNFLEHFKDIEFNDDIIEAIKESKNPSILNFALSAIKDEETFDKLFTIEYAKGRLNLFNDDLFNEKHLIKRIVQSKNMYYTEDIIEKYKYSNIRADLSNMVFDKGTMDHFLKKMEPISEADIFEFVSVNPLFVSCFNKEQCEVFFEAEMDDIKEITKVPDGFKIKTMSYNIGFITTHDTPSIYLENGSSHTFHCIDKNIVDTIYTTLQDKLNIKEKITNKNIKKILNDFVDIKFKSNEEVVKDEDIR